MDLKFLKINLLIIGIFFISFFAFPVSARNVNVNVNVYICNNDLICDLDQGEDYLNCSADCPVPICNNNGLCESGLGEDIYNCSSDCHPIPTSTPTSTGGSTFLPQDSESPLISRISVFSISRTNANVSWITNELAYCQLDWGESSEYSGGSIVEISFFTNHSTEIPNLKAGTNYYFQISCFDRSHNLGRVTNVWFATLPLSYLPSPVSPGAATGITPGKRPIPISGSSTYPQNTSTPTGVEEVDIPQQSSSSYAILKNWSMDIIESVSWAWVIIALMVILIWWFILWKRRKRGK